jgi:cysteine-rich repeat protein
VVDLADLLRLVGDDAGVAAFDRRPADVYHLLEERSPGERIGAFRTAFRARPPPPGCAFRAVPLRSRPRTGARARYDVNARLLFGILLVLSLVACDPAGDDDSGGAGGSGGTGAVSRCGDGAIDGGEACDDGAANDDTVPDACRTDCTAPRCGDGVIDRGEACDDGAANDDAAPGACRTDCAPARCGDGVIDAGEACDDGAANDDAVPGACRTRCALPWCGDGVLDPDEACDDGAANSDTAPDACRTACVPAGCGDGVIDAGEPCDDGAGNGTAPDACRPGCVAPTCGDGIVDAGEGCDEGAENDDARADACRTSCAPAGCGDGVLDAGEACDDGAGNSDTAANSCRTSCTPAGCGDGVRDAGEVCDDGAGNSDTAADACRTTCTPAGCGDGVRDAGEGCDTGPLRNDTEPGACRLACVAPACGDGIVDPAEACDDGAANSDTAPGACRTTCRAAGCGDGVLDAGEECDDGNFASGDDCTPACTFALDSWAWQKGGVLFENPPNVTGGPNCGTCDGAPALVNVNGTLHLFFARLPATGGYSRKLHHATSTDGVAFSTPVQVTGLSGSSQVDPTVVWDGSLFRLWYLEGSKISHATSPDGATWTMVQSDVLPKGPTGAFDQALVRYPTVLPDDAGGWTLWYTGATPASVYSIGRATSVNGTTWAKSGQVIARGTGSAFDNAAAGAPRVIPLASGGYLMWYSGYDLSRTNPGPWRIGAASSADGIVWDKLGVSIPLSTVGTDSRSTREPAVAPFDGGWLMIYVGLGDDGFWRLHRATSSHAP